ncbi:hypothetical protein BGZ89_007988 [Linnemannia elongata]|nr:hypothetical protein BGZ89_007988 [Linnemannia elongata]
MTQEHLQGFRSVHKSELPSSTSVPFDSPKITHIGCYTDPDISMDFILWEDIQRVFDKALFVRNKTKIMSFVIGKDYRFLEPYRIEVAPDIVLDVVVDDKPITATDTATVDAIASLQLAVQNILLNMPHRTLIGSTTHDLPYGNETKATPEHGHTGNPEITSPHRGPQASECHLQGNDNVNTIENQRSEATGNVTRRLYDPQDESAIKDMTLMHTMINAHNGDIQAVVALGDRYKDGRELHQDYHAALGWYCKAADQGHIRSQYNIGLLYDQGHDTVPRSHTKAFEWFFKAAIQGDVDAQVKVSQAYTDGAGVPEDHIEAMEWSVKAAENGHARMQCNMGAAYEKGHGVPQSDSRSFRWYLKAADQGFAEAQERVAAAFEAGRGVPEDGTKAIEWYTKAADQDLPAAQCALGRSHKLGLCGLPEDRSKAVDWYIKAAVQGHAEAQSMLRKIYYDSRPIFDSDWSLESEVQSSIEEWFKDAAKKGVAYAQVCMADMYSDGRGVDKDNFKAFEWYLKAAKQGNEGAQRSVAFRYGYGIGVTQSREESIEWYLRLATSGNLLAAEEIREMLRQ